MPTVIMSWFNDTSRPRRTGGEISAMYSGTTSDAAPMASPITNREPTRTAVPGASPETTAPAANTIAVATRLLRRPRPSASGPAARAPNTAPSSKAATTTCWPPLDSPNSGVMYSSAPEITPVS